MRRCIIKPCGQEQAVPSKYCQGHLGLWGESPELRAIARDDTFTDADVEDAMRAFSARMSAEVAMRPKWPIASGLPPVISRRMPEWHEVAAKVRQRRTDAEIWEALRGPGVSHHEAVQLAR